MSNNGHVGRNVAYRVAALVLAALMVLGTLAGVIVYFVG
jgi:hypothetical protein